MRQTITIAAVAGLAVYLVAGMLKLDQYADLAERVGYCVDTTSGPAIKMILAWPLVEGPTSGTPPITGRLPACPGWRGWSTGPS